MDAHPLPQYEIYTCTECKEESTDWDSMSDHIFRHPEKIKVEKTPACGEHFVSASLTEHLCSNKKGVHPRHFCMIPSHGCFEKDNLLRLRKNKAVIEQLTIFNSQPHARGAGGLIGKMIRDSYKQIEAEEVKN